MHVLECGCTAVHRRRRIVLTGGPGAGKTAALEMARSMVCRHLRIVPEAASILFVGGFPRRNSIAAQEAAQVAIFAVQRQLEAIEKVEEPPGVALCDRGAIDSLAYWPSEQERFWRQVGSSREQELLRYDAVIHMRTPGVSLGYDRRNPMRIESAAQAAEIDRRIAEVWRGHPRRSYVESSPDFLAKIRRTLDLIVTELPPCCRLRLTQEGAPAPA
jgi:predicted ATPase